MEFGLRVVSELNWFFVGLDLGQRRDYSALVVLEKADILLDEVDWATYERRRARRYRVRFVERVPLGTPYPDVVERVRRVVRSKALAGRCTLVMDATCVGAPVLDMLRRANLGCGIEPVVVTGGERESHGGGVWHVPKRDLITGLRVMLERRELRLSARVGSVRLLAKELENMSTRMGSGGRESFGAWREGEHDDLVTAAALACWRARWKSRDIGGTRSLGLG